VPRIADANLSDRILNVAHDLIKKKGVDAVTLRAVAIQAKTTTPTVYARFATKEDLLLALADKLRLEFAAELMQQPTLHKAARLYLDFAMQNPADYKLVYDFGWPRVFMKDANQPGVVWARERFAELYGGSPQDYIPVVECLWMEMHGGASFLAKALNPQIAKRLYKSCLHSCDVIVGNARLFTT